MINLHEIKNKLKEQQELYMQLFSEDDLNARDNIKQEIDERTINENDLAEYEKSILKEAREFNIDINNNFDVYDWKPLAPTLAHFIKHRAHWLVVNKEWCEKLYSKLVERTKPGNISADYWIKQLEESIETRYKPIMNICKNKWGFDNDKEILLKDFKFKLEQLYFPYVKSDNFFTTKSINHNTVKGNHTTIPLKDEAFETLGRVGATEGNYKDYLTRLTKDDNSQENLNISEGQHLDLNKIMFINNILDDFKVEQIRVLDKYFYHSSWF